MTTKHCTQCGAQLVHTGWCPDCSVPDIMRALRAHLDAVKVDRKEKAMALRNTWQLRRGLNNKGWGHNG